MHPRAMRRERQSALVRGGRRIALVAIGLSLSAAACNLLLDPDSLVSGASDGDAQVPDRVETGAGDAASASDATIESGPKAGPGRAPPDGAVPQCVPPPPGDAEAVAVTWAGLLTPPPCPAGYAAAPVATAFADFDGGGATCALGSCACPGATGAATCTMALEYYEEGTCTQPSGTAADPLPPGICTRVAGGNVAFGRNRGFVDGNGVTCNPAGAPQTTKPDALWGTAVKACRPAAAPSPASACGDAGLVAMPPVAKEAFACYVATGACAPSYSLDFTFSTTLDVDDTRTCGCGCTKEISANGCAAGGTTDFYASNTCQGGAASAGNGQACRPIGAYGSSVTLTAAPAPAANAVTCAPNVKPAGKVTAKSPPVKYCCMSRCDACKVNAGVPGAACRSEHEACTLDAECATYRTCLDQQCGGNPCAVCQTPSAVDAGAVARYDAFTACRTTACAPVCP